MFSNTTDNKIYYSYDKYNVIEHCGNCNKKEECNSCLNGYSFANIDGEKNAY